MRDSSQIYLPAPGSPRWIAPSETSELIYLSWGLRDFSRHPIQEHCNPGWSYVIVYAGAVHFYSGEDEVTVEASQCVLISPGYSHGFRHETGEQCRVLTWIFRSGLTLPELEPDQNSFRVFTLEPTALQFIKNLHAQSREEISHIQDLFESSIKRIQGLLDIQLFRATKKPRTQTALDIRLVRARSWMNSNLELVDPVRSLCSYLQISQSTLYRLFRRSYNMSPRDMHHRLRMEEARRLIEKEGWQVKQAAYRLGYRHASDLSRALSRFFEKQRYKP